MLSKSVKLLAVVAVSLAMTGSVALVANAKTNAKYTSSTVQPLVMLPSPYGTFPDNFNPFSSSANPGTIGLIYQPLFYQDNVSGHTFPLLGTSYSWSNHNKTLTVDLRKGVKWTDGVPFTAKDVVFSFDMIKKYPTADINGVWTQLSGVTASGNYKVVFNFKQANVPFAYYVLSTTIVPQHIWSKVGDPTKLTNSNPVGTGPYLLLSFNSQVYKFSSNSHYWGGAPAVKSVEYPAFTSNTSADLALAKGQATWGGLFIPGIQSVYTSKNPNNHYWFPPNNVVMLYTNLQDPLLKNLVVRKAISMAIDRQKIYMEGEYGYEPVASPTGLIMPNNKSWLNTKLPKADQQFTYSPSAAIKLLESAGYKQNSQGIFVSPQGKPLNFTLQVVSGWTDWDADAALIAQDLKSIGINVTVQEEQYGAYYSNIGNPKKNYQLAISWTNSGPTPYYLYENMLNPKGNFNVEQLNNPKITGLLDKYSTTSNLTTQKQYIYQIQQYVAEQLPSIPLVYGATWYEYNNAQYTGWPTPSNPYINPAPYTNVAQAIVLTHLRPVK